MSVSMWRRRAGLTAQPQPAPAAKVVGRRQEIIARGTNAPFAIGAKSAQRDGTPPRRADRPDRPPSPFFRRGFPDRAAASVGPSRQINDADIRSFARRFRAPSRRLSSFSGLYRPLPMRAAAALEGRA
jgi:hypothetical protein